MTRIEEIRAKLKLSQGPTYSEVRDYLAWALGRIEQLEAALKDMLAGCADGRLEIDREVGGGELYKTAYAIWKDEPAHKALEDKS